jgi:hypothetical protein
MLPDPPRRRFPAPWRAVSTPGGWRVEDATGMALAYVYGDDAPEGVNQRKLTRDEARRIAAGIARIPERQGRGCRPRWIGPAPLGLVDCREPRRRVAR